MADKAVVGVNELGAEGNDDVCSEGLVGCYVEIGCGNFGSPWKPVAVTMGRFFQFY